MFDRLAASFNIAFKGFPMFDQVQTFSSKILHYKQMFDPCHTKLVRAGKSGQSQGVFPACHVIISAGIHTKCCVGSFFGCYNITSETRALIG